MFILKANDLYKEWHGVTLFEKVTFEVGVGERIALFGRNGVGKTTLLQGLLGRIAFDGGRIQRELPIEQWGWLDQHIEQESERTLTTIDFVRSGDRKMLQLHQRLAQLQAQIAEAGSAKASHLSTVMEQYSEIYERYVQMDGYGWEVEVEKCLQLMNLEPALWTIPFNQLSGGQKTKAQLAALILFSMRCG